MLKPGMVVSDEGLAELADRLAATGYGIAELRTFTPAEVRAGSLIRRHYHDHFAVARAGTLLPDERARLAEIYATPAFVERFGDPASLPVVPSEALADRCGVPAAVIGAWAARAAAAHGVDSGQPLACNEVGELADVQLLVRWEDLEVDGDRVPRDDGPRPPLFVLNPQMALLASWWEDGPDATVVARLAVTGAHPWPWAQMRGAFLGTGSPSAWPEGSLRRDLLEGRSALHYRDGVAMGAARNGVHLSNGPIEALRELAVWFDVAPGDTVIGRRLLDAGLDPDAVLDAVYVEDAEGLHALAGRSAGLDLDGLVALLRAGRLYPAHKLPR